MLHKIKSTLLFFSLFLFLSITPSIFENGDAKAVCKSTLKKGGVDVTGKDFYDVCKEIGGTPYTNKCSGTKLTVRGNSAACLIDVSHNKLSQAICNALGIIKGKGGKAFAAFAVIAAGIGFFSGKISWGLLIGVTCGIAIMFGSATIVTAISGSSGDEC